MTEEKKERTKPYKSPYDAMDRLTRNGIKVHQEGPVITITGQPGLHLLGAVDYLRQNRMFTVRMEAR